MLILTPEKTLMLLPTRMKEILGQKEWGDLKKGHKATFLALVLLLTTLCAYGQRAEQAGQSEGSSGEPTRGFVTREPEKPSSKQSKEITVTESYNEEGEGDRGDGFLYKISYEKSSIDQQKIPFLYRW